MKPIVYIIPVHSAPFDPPKDRDDITPLSDWSEGGINLSDGTQGLQVQFWHFTVEGAGVSTGIYLESSTYPKTLQLSAPNITWIRGTFDQNMHPAISYISDGLSYLWWWDPIIHAQATLPLALDVIFPNVIMDDTRPRETQLGNNDIVLTYLRGDPLAPSLYFRLQRDRYGVEYLVSEPWYSGFPDYIEKPYINRTGMNEEWRFQLEIRDREADFPT